ncbi:telomerase Cajal body protein 1 homolog [Drosophila bipectinata]|uniref:telomerase Cajal body protein 1 homolog n=1 Tax=Drosophila bipectinata TaxID=42026 RepID=UPI001C8A9778|nr:telomerase Cajal body protein 1 homolog [Drosophila bipectinata]
MCLNMDDSINLSTNMSYADKADLTASILNHNVSFNSTMETSMESPLPKLSVTLTDAEIKKLRQAQLEDSSLNESVVSIEPALIENSSQYGISDSVISMDETVEVAAIEPREEVEEAVPIEDPADYFETRLVELSRRCWPSSQDAQHYTKGCCWSPDGTCLLVPVHLDGMHVMELPADLYSATTLQQTRQITQLKSAVHVPESGTVYDCVWYPHMNSQQPDTCLWLASRQHEPVHMWDAFDGALRCSYSGYDAVDEVMAAISLAFSHDGEKIFAGYKRCIKIFDTSRPGRMCDDYPVKAAISCIAQTTEHPKTVTCGNWSGYIQHFDLRSSPKQGPLFTLGGHKGGITQLRYAGTEMGEWYLFSGARKCNKLLQWDMRNYKEPLVEFKRNVNTNQRVQFDLTADNKWLASGDTHGLLNVWDLAGDRDPAAIPLHSDCCNGVSLNPVFPIVATSSGQFHFVKNAAHTNSSILNGSTIDADPETELPEGDKQDVVYENSVCMWWSGRSE